MCNSLAQSVRVFPAGEPHVHTVAGHPDPAVVGHSAAPLRPARPQERSPRAIQRARQGQQGLDRQEGHQLRCVLYYSRHGTTFGQPYNEPRFTPKQSKFISNGVTEKNVILERDRIKI